jgi:hypothetical protein
MLFLYPLTCFSGIGGSRLLKVEPPSLPHFSSLEEREPLLLTVHDPSLFDPITDKKKDGTEIGYNDLADVNEYEVLDFLTDEEKVAFALVNPKQNRLLKEHKEVTKYLSLRKNEGEPSRDVISLLKQYLPRDPKTKLALESNPKIQHLLMEGHEINSKVLLFITQSFPNLRSLKLYNTYGLKDSDLEILSSSYPNLTHLLLRGSNHFNDIGDRGLEFIAKCTHLTHLEIKLDSHYTDEGLRALSSLEGLTHLALRGETYLGAQNRFTDEGLIALAGLRALTRLELKGVHNVIIDKGFSVLSTLPLLTHLALEARFNEVQNWGPIESLSGEMLIALSSMKLLTHLELITHCGATDEILEVISALTLLTHFEIHGVNNSFTDEGLKALMNLTHLTHLAINGFRSSFTDEGLKALSSLALLTHLEVGRFTIYECETFKVLSVFKNLTHLIIGTILYRKNKNHLIKGKGARLLKSEEGLTALVETLKDLVHFTHLELGGLNNKYTDKSLEVIADHLKGLTYLRLDGLFNEFTDKGLEAIGTLSLLTHLELGECEGPEGNYEQFTDKGLLALKGLKGLTYLHLPGDNNKSKRPYSSNKSKRAYLSMFNREKE